MNVWRHRAAVKAPARARTARRGRRLWSTGPVHEPDAATPAPRSRHERKRLQRREHLYETAIALFTEHGYEAIAMDDIAERADVARATVFNHFRYKSSFIEEWGERRRALASEVARGTRSDCHSLRTALEHYLSRLAALSTQNRAETTALMRAANRHVDLWGDPPMRDDLRVLLTRARGSAGTPEDIDVTRASLLIATSYTATLTRWLETEPPFDLRAELMEVLDLLLGGIAPDRSAEPHR